MRGVHDSGLEATGSPEVKARLVERIMGDQQELLAKRVNPDVARIPQVIWLYKESLDLYRVGMKIPKDVTLGWTDDNYGYIREMPNKEEQERPGGSALYYHVSYWGEPHDHLWLSTTPPALMREELSKAWQHGVRRMWILNVGDLKPAEQDMDYFFRMAWDEPGTAQLSQRDFLSKWNEEQFPKSYARVITDLMDSYYQLNFIRKPEFMGFNENNHPIQRTAFNPLAWGDQNQQRLQAWDALSTKAAALGERIPTEYRDAYFELIGYPIEGAAAQNAKLLWNDRTYLDAAQGRSALERTDANRVQEAYDKVQSLTKQYNSLAAGKWEGIMSSHPRERLVFDLPVTADAAAKPEPLPETWGASASGGNRASANLKGFREVNQTISIGAAHFATAANAGRDAWHVEPELGLYGGAIWFGEPGSTAAATWVQAGGSEGKEATSRAPSVEYSFQSTSSGDATLKVFLLPTFPVDSDHRLRYAVALDGKLLDVVDASGTEHAHPGVSPWKVNVLRNAEAQTIALGNLPTGKHVLRLIYGDPGVVFQHITITFPGAPPAYPFPPESRNE
jgi:hypothetical protein